MAETVYLVGLIYGSNHNMAGCACTFKTLIISMIQENVIAKLLLLNSCFVQLCFVELINDWWLLPLSNWKCLLCVWYVCIRWKRKRIRIGIFTKGPGSNTNERETLVNLWLRMIINLLLLHDVIIGKDVLCVSLEAWWRKRQQSVKGDR